MKQIALCSGGEICAVFDASVVVRDHAQAVRNTTYAQRRELMDSVLSTLVSDD